MKFNQENNNFSVTQYRLGWVSWAIALMLIVLPTTLSAQEDTVLEEVIIVGQDYLSILPDQSSESAFGLDKSLTETPRSITEVSDDLIEKFALRSVDDLVRLTPGAFTSSFFGIRGAMDIRGEPADNYFRGFRRIANPGAFNTIVRGAEKLEVLRGPVSPLYGSGSVGGQLNYIPKSAKSDIAKYVGETSGDISATVGSYDQRIASFNLGVPLNIGGREGGMHIFAEIEDSESFYDYYEPTSELIQLAFDIDISETSTIEFGVQYQTTDSIQVPGWNRITQDLIDNGNYITGAPPVRNSDNPIGLDRLLPQESGFLSTAAGTGINDTFSGVGTFCVPDIGFNQATYNGRDITCFGGNATPWISPISNPGVAQIDHETTFIDPIDFADTTAITAYVDFKKELANGSVWKTEFFYDYMDHTKFQSWGFTALYPDANAMEFRTSLRFDFSAGSGETTNIVGVNYRTEDIELNHAFFDETFDFRDIIVGPTPDDRIDWAVVDPYENATLGVDADGNPTVTGTVRRNFNLSEVSTADNFGIFFLSDMTFGGLNLLLGGRYDIFDVESEDVATTILGRPFSDLGNVSDDDSAFSYNLSLSYASEAGFVPYATYSVSNSLSTNQLGGISPSTVTDGLFLQESILMELGVKYEGLDGRLYTALTYYDQEKTQRTGETLALVEVFGKGFEFEARAVINDNLSLLGTFTSTETTEIGNIFTVVNGAAFAEQNGLQPSDVYGGRISGDRDTFFGAGTELDRGGLPDTIFSLYATWRQQFESNEVTASLGFTWVDETYIDVFESVLLPDYMVWTGSLRYQRDRFAALLQVNNLFDEEYYTSADLFDSVVVKPSEGRTVSLTLSYAFGE